MLNELSKSEAFEGIRESAMCYCPAPWGEEPDIDEPDPFEPNEPDIDEPIKESDIDEPNEEEASFNREMTGLTEEG